MINLFFKKSAHFEKSYKFFFDQKKKVINLLDKCMNVFENWPIIKSVFKRISC